MMSARSLLLTGAGAAAAAATVIRFTSLRHRRLLHPDGRSFSGELRVPGGAGTGSALFDRPGRHPVTVRVSKGAGTRPGVPDVLGLAVRVHGPVAGHRCDLLLSSCGGGRLSRHVPVPRRRFGTAYGSILPYRTGSGRTLLLGARPAPGAADPGRTLEDVVTAAERDGSRWELVADAGGPAERVAGEVCFGQPLTAAVDAALAFDPIRNVRADLHPTGLVHGSRAFAYRWSQKRRGARPADGNRAAVTRTAARR